jgi:UDP-N-acetylglucosamine--N-acetylmuramyl-(pentapeptide) pyrophosphoryl-undecaprenol N-acetylglucosamine transferase
MTGNVLACASSGGHFKQLLRLVDRLPDCGSVTWLTYDSGLTQDLLAASGRSADRVVHAPYAAPRGVVNLARDALVARRVLREAEFDLAISTGAGLAVATLPVARSTGVRSVFIESATRAEGPSMSGRILERVPGVELYTQNPGYGPRWGHVGSVHDEFVAGDSRVLPAIDRVVVTLGTIQPYGFRRLVLRLLELLPTEAAVLWQTGATDVAGLPIDGRTTVPGPELERAIAEADVVIAHAGTGTALTAFELGRCPVLVPRRHSFGEHIDDHQVETARMLAVRGLAIYAEAAELDITHLREAARRTVARLDRPPVLTL